MTNNIITGCPIICSNLTAANAIATSLGTDSITPSSGAVYDDIGTVNNRKVVLYDINSDQNQYIGFGVNPNVLRYQVDQTSSDHVWYAATASATSNELYRIQGVYNLLWAAGKITTMTATITTTTNTATAALPITTPTGAIFMITTNVIGQQTATPGNTAAFRAVSRGYNSGGTVTMGTTNLESLSNKSSTTPAWSASDAVSHVASGAQVVVQIIADSGITENFRVVSQIIYY